jgi:hypothetical protein
MKNLSLLQLEILAKYFTQSELVNLDEETIQQALDSHKHIIKTPESGSHPDIWGLTNAWIDKGKI